MFNEFYPFNFDDSIDEPDGNEVNSDLVIPDSFAACMSYEQQVMFLYNLLKDMTANATVDNGTGAPSVEVVENGDESHINLYFAFHNLKGERGESGSPGQPGAPGEPGQDGSDGYSPTVSITTISGGHRITITDKDGEHIFDVMDGLPGEPGQDGSDGSDGYSPTVSVTDITGGHQVTITDADGAHTFTVMNGLNGQDGSDGAPGYSPEVTISTITGGHRVTITDEDHPLGQSFDVMDGQDGQAIPPVITAQATVDSSTGTPSVTVTKTGTDEAPTFTFAFHNLRGVDGQNGTNGSDGSDGYSPEVTISTITGGHRVTITDEDHPSGQSFDIMDGVDGQNGQNGQDGTDGTSAYASVSKSGNTATITCTDANGTTTATVTDGSDGAPGQNGIDGAPGYSPVVTITAITGGYRVTITDENHPSGQSFDIMNGISGQDGSDGTNGTSAYASVSKSGNTATITCTDANGTTTATVTDGSDGAPGQNGQDGAAATIQVGTVTTGAAGTNASVTNSGTSSAAVFDFTIPRGADGQTGPTGPAGPGVASGGTAGQILAKASGTDYDTEWIDAPSGSNLVATYDIIDNAVLQAQRTTCYVDVYKEASGYKFHVRPGAFLHNSLNGSSHTYPISYLTGTPYSKQFSIVQSLSSTTPGIVLTEIIKLIGVFKDDVWNGTAMINYICHNYEAGSQYTNRLRLDIVGNAICNDFGVESLASDSIDVVNTNPILMQVGTAYDSDVGSDYYQVQVGTGYYNAGIGSDLIRISGYFIISAGSRINADTRYIIIPLSGYVLHFI